MNGMSEHKRNILVTACLEANAFYNSRNGGGKYETPNGRMFDMIAEAYLMRVETITKEE